MTDLQLIAFEDDADLATIQNWFTDPETARRVSYPTRAWFAFVRSEPSQYVWLAYAGDKPVGYIQCEREADGAVALALVIRPDVRNWGYGRQLLTAIIALPLFSDAPMIWGAVEKDNSSSIRCAAAAGFVPEPYSDEPTMIKMVYHRVAKISALS